MELHLKRDQAKKLFGGAKFILTARVSLTDEERKLIETYKAHGEVIATKDLRNSSFLDTITTPGAVNGGNIQAITIGALLTGDTYKCGSLGDVLVYENAVKEGCKIFRKYLEAMKRFGGEEILTIDLNGEIKTKE